MDTPSPVTNLESTNPKPAPTPKRTRALQDQAVSAYITDSLVTLHAALALPPTTAALLTARGYDADEIAVGIDLQDKAQNAFNAQLPAIGADRRLTELQRAAIRTQRDDYATYRGIARAAYPGHADRVALGLTGDVPEDFGKFVTAAKASYAAGKIAHYTVKLTRRGYPPGTLDTHVAALDKLTDPDHADPAAVPPPAPTPPPAGEETADDETPNEALRAAYDALRAWMKEFKGVARTIFRKRAEVLHDLHL